MVSLTAAMSSDLRATLPRDRAVEERLAGLHLRAVDELIRLVSLLDAAGATHDRGPSRALKLTAFRRERHGDRVCWRL